ncbi:hypothetical protein BDV95DRAFT_597472 [Massariosphaeria phaeospora]|uniref:Uncharacterized protein n=1 Tax=Massariosphaeria phaeospora TaxID=100035 RepID=A0A7C8I4Q2_9PLEO|nr:hypothetical protein BDV95DRAFT_597472 [Massariosphaeria phaeospora]
MARKRLYELPLTPAKRARADVLLSSSQALVIHDDDSTSDTLNELDSADVPVPTQFQLTNKNSLEVILDAQPVFQAPFDYSWIKWDSVALGGCRRIATPFRTKA